MKQMIPTNKKSKGKIVNETLKGIAFILFAPLIFLLPGCSPLGSPVDKEKSNNYYYSRNRKNIIYSRMGNWFELSCEKIGGVDLSTFIVLSEDCAKDTNYIYVRYKAMPQINTKTFRIINENAGCDFQYVYRLSNYPDTAIIINGADPKTYKGLNRKWAVDRNHVFYRDSIIEADVHTFEVIYDNYAKDKDKLYVGDHGIPENTANLQLMNGLFIRAQTVVYSGTSTIPLLHGEQSIVEDLEGGWLRVDGKVFFYSIPIDNPDLDHASFEVIGGAYSKDKKHVYIEYYGEHNDKDMTLKTIPGSDAATFHFLGARYQADKNQVYWAGEVVEGANPMTFRYNEKTNMGIDGLKRYKYGELVTE